MHVLSWFSVAFFLDIALRRGSSWKKVAPVFAINARALEMASSEVDVAWVVGRLWRRNEELHFKPTVFDLN